MAISNVHSLKKIHTHIYVYLFIFIWLSNAKNPANHLYILKIYKLALIIKNMASNRIYDNSKWKNIKINLFS